MPSLDDIKNNNFIDTTQGKVTEPLVNAKYMTDDDPAFTPTPQVVTGDIPSHEELVKKQKVKEGKDTNTDEASVTTDIPEDKPIGVKVVQTSAPFDDENLTEFDINSLERRPAPVSEFEVNAMSKLDKAVKREKQSIADRIQHITDTEKAALEEMYQEGKITKNGEKYVDAQNAEFDNHDITTDEIDTGEPIPEEEKDLFDDDYNSDMMDKEEEKEVTKPAIPVTPVNKITLSDENQPISKPGNVEAKDVDEFPIPDMDQLTSDLSAEIGEDINMDFETDEEAAKRLANDVRSRISPYTKKIDFNDFTIDDKPTVINIEDHLNFSQLSTADWVAPNAGRVITSSALSGPEMLAINPENSSQNRINTLRKIYSVLYKHVESDKPKTFDEWLKTTRFNDLDHYYFAAFKATFSGSNFMHYECNNPNCKHTFIKDLSFDDYVVYKDDAAKEHAQSIITSGDTSISPLETVMCQVSDNYVFVLHNPTIYNTVIEVAGLSDEFLQKYSDLMDVILYVEDVYRINYENHKLEKVDLKPDKNNITKTAARKINILSRILNTMSSDSYYELRRHIVKSFPNLNDITYHIPACKCEKCGSEIAEIKNGVEAQTLLFMRHQLGVFVVL